MAEVPNVVPALPELFLASAIMAMLMLGVFQPRDTAEKEIKASRLISFLCVITLILAVLLVSTLSGGRLVTFQNMFVSDPFAVYSKILVLIGSALAIGNGGLLGKQLAVDGGRDQIIDEQRHP